MLTSAIVYSYNDSCSIAIPKDIVTAGHSTLHDSIIQRYLDHIFKSQTPPKQSSQPSRRSTVFQRAQALPYRQS